jgi:hypothetical protein
VVEDSSKSEAPADDAEPVAAPSAATPDPGNDEE